MEIYFQLGNKLTSGVLLILLLFMFQSPPIVVKCILSRPSAVFSERNRVSVLIPSYL